MIERQAFFLTAGDGQRFCLFTPAHGQPERGAVLYLHPLAEELNKTRQPVARQVRALAAKGYSVLQIDLKGCGDSSHDFAEASWNDWLDDVALGWHWLRNRTQAPCWLWGLRAGALLAVDAGRRSALDCHYLLWQPIPTGERALQQFFRLGVAAGWLGTAGQGRGNDPKARLASGQTIEIAGYRMSPALAEGLQQASLLPPPNARSLCWLERATGENAPITASTATILTAWQEAAVPTHHAAIHGPAFWQSTEIAEIPTWQAATLEALAP